MAMQRACSRLPGLAVLQVQGPELAGMGGLVVGLRAPEVLPLGCKRVVDASHGALQGALTGYLGGPHTVTGVFVVDVPPTWHKWIKAAQYKSGELRRRYAKVGRSGLSCFSMF
jgi:hypothetical protein